MFLVNRAPPKLEPVLGHLAWPFFCALENHGCGGRGERRQAVVDPVNYRQSQPAAVRQCNIATSESVTWVGRGGVYGWVDMRRFDSFLKRGCVVPGASFVAKLHSPATETNRPKLLALAGQILNLYGHDQTPREEQSEVNFSRLDANNPKFMDQVIQVSK